MARTIATVTPPRMRASAMMETTGEIATSAEVYGAWVGVVASFTLDKTRCPGMLQ